MLINKIILPKYKNSIRYFSNNNFFWFEKNKNNIYNFGIKSNFVNMFGQPKDCFLNEKYIKYKIPINENENIGYILSDENKIVNIYSPLDNLYLNDYNNINTINNNFEKNYLIQFDSNSDILRETYFKFFK